MNKKWSESFSTEERTCYYLLEDERIRWIKEYIRPPSALSAHIIHALRFYDGFSCSGLQLEEDGDIAVRRKPGDMWSPIREKDLREKEFLILIKLRKLLEEEEPK